MDSPTPSVLVGLIAGVVLIATFGIIFADQDGDGSNNVKIFIQPQLPSPNPMISTVYINSSKVSIDLQRPQFEPRNITVVIGVNNTVRWVNNDSVPSSVVADSGSVR